ncbi:MAG: helix-turn-helix domain-containing protein [bacterium]
MLFKNEIIKSRILECLDRCLAVDSLKKRRKVYDEYNFGSLPRILRYSLFLTHKELARALKVDPSSVLDWEMGRHKPVKKMLDAIRKGLLENAMMP